MDTHSGIRVLLQFRGMKQCVSENAAQWHAFVQHPSVLPLMAEGCKLQVTTRIKVDLTHPHFGGQVDAVQGDGNARYVEVTLLQNGLPWEVPEDAEVAVAYTKPDRTKGLYNKLADDTPAVTVNGSVVTVILAHQMLTVPGTVQTGIVIHNAKLDQLTTFPFSVRVARNPFAGAQKSEDYIRLQWLEDKLDEYLRMAKESGVFDGPQGPRGEKGDTPVKGTDYFTDADKAELVNSVLTALPAAEDVEHTFTPTWISGKYIFYATGTEAESAAYVLTDYIDVSRYACVNVLTKVAGYAGVCLYDAQKKYLTGFQPAYQLTAIDVSGANYLRVACMAAYADTAVIENNPTEGTAIKLKYHDSVGNYTNPGISINTDALEDGYLYSSGVLVGTSALYRHTGFIPIYGGNRITLHNVTPANGVVVHFYNDLYEVVGNVPNDNTGTVQASITVEAPYDAVYMRFNIRIDVTDVTTVSAEYADGIRNGYLADTLVRQWYDTSHQKITNLYRRAVSKLICTVVDDDTADTASVQRAKAAADANGIKLTFATLTYNWTKDGNLKDTLLSLEREGHQVVLHAYAQKDEYRNPDADENLAVIEDDFVHGLRDMQAAGFATPRFWVAPYGANTESIQRLAGKWGVAATCITGNAYNTTDGSAGRYSLKRYALNERDSTGTSDEYTTSLAGLKAAAAEAANHSGWLIVMTHFANWTDDEHSRFDDFVTYAKSLGYTFMTLGEAWDFRKAIYDLNDMF